MKTLKPGYSVEMLNWLRFGVHSKDYSEHTLEELNRVKSARLSPRTINDLLNEIGVIVESVKG